MQNWKKFSMYANYFFSILGFEPDFNSILFLDFLVTKKLKNLLLVNFSKINFEP